MDGRVDRPLDDHIITIRGLIKDIGQPQWRIAAQVGWNPGSFSAVMTGRTRMSGREGSRIIALLQIHAEAERAARAARARVLSEREEM